MTIVSQQGDRYSPYLLITVPEDFWRLNTECDHSISTKRSPFTLCPITAPRDFWRSNTECDYDIPPFTKERSLFTLPPITAPRHFWGLNTGCDHSIPTKRSLFLLSPITAPPNFLPGGLTIDRWTWYPDNGNLCIFFTNAHTPLYSTLIIPHFYHFDHKKTYLNPL